MSENDVRRWSAFSLTPRNVLFGCNTDFKWTVSLQVMWFFSSASGRTQRKHTSSDANANANDVTQTWAGTLVSSRHISGDASLVRLHFVQAQLLHKSFSCFTSRRQREDKRVSLNCETSGMNSGVIINSTVCSRLCLELTAAFISESTCPVDLNAPEALLPEHLQLRLADKSMKKQRWVSHGV